MTAGQDQVATVGFREKADEIIEAQRDIDVGLNELLGELPSDPAVKKAEETIESLADTLSEKLECIWHNVCVNAKRLQELRARF